MTSQKTGVIYGVHHMSTLYLTIRSEFFRLPTRCVNPHFGLSRSFYYHLDATGQVLLVRLRRRNSQRGVTLVSYDAMSTFPAEAEKRSSDAGIDEVKLPSAPAAGDTYGIVQSFPEETELMRKLTLI